jgi:hypothetical protein
VHPAIVGRYAVAQDYGLQTMAEGFAGGLLHPDLGHGSAYDRRIHVFGEQDVVEVGAEECPAPILVHDVVSRQNGQFVDHRYTIQLPGSVLVAAHETGPAAVYLRVQLG